jgi:nucleotide-binding universal stress UspA family protein
MRLTLLTVLDGSPDAGEAELRSTLQRHGIEGDAVVETLQEKEKTSTAILRAVKHLDAAMLALDSRGHGALRHLVHGSVALELLRDAGMPLMLTGPNVEPLPPKGTPYGMVICHDGSEAANAAPKQLAGLLEGRPVRVTLLRVHEHEPAGRDNEAARARATAELQEARDLLPATLEVEPVVREIVRGGGVDTAIVETARERGALAIAMSTQGHNPRRHVLAGSVALTMLGRSTLPLILAPAEV